MKKLFLLFIILFCNSANAQPWIWSATPTKFGIIIGNDNSPVLWTDTGATGQFLKSNGGVSKPSWATISGTGTVTSFSTSLNGLSVATSTTTPALSGTLGVSSGGTGGATAALGLKNLLPDTTGNSGKALEVVAGGGISWQTVSGGGGSGTWITEIPSGVENDTNVVYTISHTPISDSTTDFIYLRNGLEQAGLTKAGWSAADYTLSGTTLTVSHAPSSTDKIFVRYRY